MSRKQYKRDRLLARVGNWNIVDDRSGFVISSAEAVIDDFRGLITSKNNFDEIHPSEIPFNYVEEMFVPAVVRVPVEEGNSVFLNVNRK